MGNLTRLAIRGLLFHQTTFRSCKAWLLNVSNTIFTPVGLQHLPARDLPAIQLPGYFFRWWTNFRRQQKSWRYLRRVLDWVFSISHDRQDSDNLWIYWKLGLWHCLVFLLTDNDLLVVFDWLLADPAPSFGKDNSVICSPLCLLVWACISYMTGVQFFFCFADRIPTFPDTLGPLEKNLNRDV